MLEQTLFPPHTAGFILAYLRNTKYSVARTWLFKAMLVGPSRPSLNFVGLISM